jgi:predicted alpha/beta superfamily hydrolase
LIRSRYRPKAGPAGIIGNSYGGSFTAHAFVKQSRLFNRYWLGSPGLFTSKSDWVGQLERVASGALRHDTKMFLSFGELEAWGAVPYYEDMGRSFGRLTNWLARHPNPQLQYRSKFYPGHTHTSVVAPAMNDALLYLYGPHFPE